MKRDISGRLSTDTAYFTQIIGDIKKGEIKIPQFQRTFVWKEQQALDLLDSIANRYPIGSILLWKTNDKLHAERNIGNFRLPETDDLTPTSYVLDGQQRVTVIYSCVGAEEKDQGFVAGYDLVNECFVEIKDRSLPPEIFPLRKIFNTTALLNYRTALLSRPNAEALQEKLDDLISAFNQYKLPVVTLKDLTIDEVCPIFERINSSGTKLSTYDLMVAATWSEDFDLNEKISGILQKIQAKGYGDTSKATILKTLSAIELNSIQDKSLRTLRDLNSNEIERLTDKTSQALVSAVDILSTQFKILSWDFLSYEANLIICAYILSGIKELNSCQVNRLKQWFWRASFGERYKVGGENFVSRDMQIVSEFVLKDNGKGEDFGKIPQSGEWGSILFRSNVARSRAFLLALASAVPRNLSNGLYIDLDSALSSYTKKEYHHVYPRGHLKNLGKGSKANVLSNIIMLTANSNKIISDTPPSVYMPKIIDALGAGVEDVFASNLLPNPAEFDYEKSTYEEFLDARGIILTKHVKQKLLTEV